MSIVLFPTPDRAALFEVNHSVLRGWCWGHPLDPVVILVHGAFDHGRMFDLFAARLAALGFHVVAIDARGHGDSGPLSSGMAWTMATVDLCALAQLLSPDAPVGLVGHSMGGGQVVTAAGVAPERIGWVVTLDGLGPPAEAFVDPGPVASATQAIENLEKWSARPPRVWASRAEMASRRGAINVRLPRAFLDHLAEHGTWEVDGGYVWKTDSRFSIGVPDGFTVEKVLAQYADVSAPVLALMSSEPDAWTDLSDAEVERRIGLLENGRWRSVPGAGHYVHIENPDFVVGAIVEFLTEIGVR